MRNTLAILALMVSVAGCKAEAEVVVAPEPTPAPAPEVAPEPEPEPEADPTDVRIVGDHLEIDQKILFGTDSDEILADSAEILDHLATLLKHHGEFASLQVIGHTDATGDKAHNQDLSERRAAAVKTALTERGVTQTIESSGKGPDAPLCTEKTDECNDKNRRVEFVVAAAEEAPAAE